jgi:NAD(P)-dependent dehydrogenase (short-subunit alcohol dehydrogenase family)
MNAFSPHWLAQFVHPAIRERGLGHAVVISSTDTRVMGANGAPHNMAKAAMEALAYTLKERCGVLVIAMAPGLVNTEIGRMIRTLHDVADMSALDAASPWPGACQPEDVATVVGDVTRPCEVGRATPRYRHHLD